MKQNNSEALKALGYKEPTISDISELHETSNNQETKAKTLPIQRVVGRSEQLPPQICYKTNEPCKHNCSGLCKESC